MCFLSVFYAIYESENFPVQMIMLVKYYDLCDLEVVD